MKIIAINNNNAYGYQNYKQQNFGANWGGVNNGIDSMAAKIGCTFQELKGAFDAPDIALRIEKITGHSGGNPTVRVTTSDGGKNYLVEACTDFYDIKFSRPFWFTPSSRVSWKRNADIAVNKTIGAMEEAAEQCP